VGLLKGNRFRRQAERNRPKNWRERLKTNIGETPTVALAGEPVPASAAWHFPETGTAAVPTGATSATICGV